MFAPSAIFDHLNISQCTFAHVFLPSKLSHLTSPLVRHSDSYIWHLNLLKNAFTVLSYLWNNPWYVYLILIACIIYNSLHLFCSYLYLSLCCSNDPISPEGSLKFHLSPLIHFSLHSFLPGAVRSKPNKLVAILDFSSCSYSKSPVFSFSMAWRDYKCQRLLCLGCFVA